MTAPTQNGATSNFKFSLAGGIHRKKILEGGMNLFQILFTKKL